MGINLRLGLNILINHVGGGSDNYDPTLLGAALAFI